MEKKRGTQVGMMDCKNLHSAPRMQPKVMKLIWEIAALICSLPPAAVTRRTRQYSTRELMCPDYSSGPDCSLEEGVPVRYSKCGVEVLMTQPQAAKQL